jgi:polysaccharide export outer membrane protein
VQVPVDYVLGGGDRIRINVFEVPEYSGDYQIPPGGDLYLPLIGRVSIAGQTQEQAAETVTAKYARFLKRPLITVSLISPRPINVAVSGEVNRPGSYTLALQGGAGDNPGVQYPTVLGAITLAEGVTLAADIRQVQLRRREGSGRDQIINLDLAQLVKQASPSQYTTLRDGDAIFIPTATNVNKAEIRQFSTASFAAAPNRPRTVTVVGEVNRPGSYVVVGGSATATATEQGGGGAGGGLPTVTRAIQLAGGITSQANVRSIQIRRLTKNGVGQNVNVNLWQLLRGGDTTQDTIVQDGDTIVIPTARNTNPAEATALADASFSPPTIQVSVVGEVKNPGLINIPPNTPLNQGLLTAGGFNNSRAKRSSVQLVRLNPDGTVIKRQIKIDLARGIDTKNNPTLRDNDIIVVGRSGIAQVGDTLGTVLNPVGAINALFGLFGL